DKVYSVTVKATDNSGASDSQTITVKVAHGNTMVGTPADDTFVFRPNFGKETVKNFDPAHDVLQFDHTTFSGVDDVLAHAKQVGKDVLISTHDDQGHYEHDNHDQGQLILKNVQLSNLTADDFRFV